MNFRDEIGRVIAKDPRYSLEAYAFVLESLHLARNRKLRTIRRNARRRGSQTTARGAVAASAHVSGRQVCHAARRLALRQYGMMAIPVLERWGLRSTSDIGEIIYNLIASGDLDKTPEDSREDFNDVFDFETALRATPTSPDDAPRENED